MSSEPRHLFLFDWSDLVGRDSASRAEALCDGWSSRLRGASPYQAAPFLGPSRTRVSQGMTDGIVSYGSAQLLCQAKPSAALGMTEHAIRPSSKKAVGGFAALRKFSGADVLS